MAYNETFLNTSNTLFDVVEGVNDVSGGVVAYVFLFIIFLFVYSQTIRNGAIPALTASSLVSLISALLLWWMGLIFWWVVIIPLVLFIIALGARYIGGA